ncbi:hypothetical protein [Wolbachia endosymbiont (group B) of Eucosma cana]|uniref:hypothetical protein n=1 Tax=Wolbachia endosymbiont (group B) of Eucosma cana TaxID=2954012 RepID=UPI0022267C0A|nr:hypothetical protein [Wolbachia endosymbiont (group B) of Eucosma cana]
MNNSIQEKKGNPVVTLKAQAEKFDFSRLRADKTNESANTGEQMYEDFRRMRFVINSKNLDQSLIGALIDGAKQYNFDEVWDRYYKNQGIPYNAPICLDHFFQSDPIFKMNMLINTSTHI